MLESAGLQGRTVQGALFNQLSAQNTLHRSPPKDPGLFDGFVFRAGNVVRDRLRLRLRPHRRLDTTRLGFGAVGQALVQALAAIRMPDGAASSSVATEPCASSGWVAKEGQAGGAPLPPGRCFAGALLLTGSGIDCVAGQLDAGATSQLELGFCSALVGWP